MADGRASKLGQRGIDTEKLDVGKKGGAGTAVAVVMVVALLAAGAAFYFLEYVPLRARLASLEDDLADATATAGEVPGLREELTAAAAELERLRAERESLASRSEESATRAAELEEQSNALRTQLEAEIERGEILLRDDRGRLTVALADRVLFPSGQAELNEHGQRILRRVAESLRGMEDKIIQVGGHSDNVAIPEDSELPFDDNWQLSSARATEVVRFLQEECEIEGERLMAIGYNEFRPVASNRSPAGRRRNRRIDLVLAPREE